MTDLQILTARDVPLGGLRAMNVRRTLPHRDRSFVGAWCFLDHYGPQVVGAGNDGGMDVAPHPHTGLQTVSWLFEGEIEHRDSGGVHAIVRPGEVNLMTAGHGIAHSEVSTAATRTLHGVQLWVVLPDSDRDVTRRFDHHTPTPVSLADGAATARVFLGRIDGVDESPVTTHTPLLGAQLDLEPGAVVEIPLDVAFEHAVLLDIGDVTLTAGNDASADTPLAFGDLACLDPGLERLVLRAGDDGARVLLLGGEPFEEDVIMWWNFVGRSHEEIAEFRDAWEASSSRFGVVEGYVGETERIPAPPLPGVRLKSRGRRGRVRTTRTEGDSQTAATPTHAPDRDASVH